MSFIIETFPNRSKQQKRNCGPPCLNMRKFFVVSKRLCGSASTKSSKSATRVTRSSPLFNTPISPTIASRRNISRRSSRAAHV